MAGDLQVGCKSLGSGCFVLNYRTISESSRIDSCAPAVAQSMQEGELMMYSCVTPNTVFEARETAHNGSAFRFSEPCVRLSAQEQYKRLIDAESARQGLPLAHLADRLDIARPRLHKVIRGKVRLGDDLRDRLFEALEIDAVRATFCVALLDDYKAYTNLEVVLTCEALKGFYYEIITRQRGEILVPLRPSIVHEAQGRAFELLLLHQTRVIEYDQTLQA